MKLKLTLFTSGIREMSIDYNYPLSSANYNFLNPILVRQTQTPPKLSRLHVLTRTL